MSIDITSLLIKATANGAGVIKRTISRKKNAVVSGTFVADVAFQGTNDTTGTWVELGTISTAGSIPDVYPWEYVRVVVTNWVSGAVTVTMSSFRGHN